jgi:hypothetical protein
MRPNLHKTLQIRDLSLEKLTRRGDAFHALIATWAVDHLRSLAYYLSIWSEALLFMPKSYFCNKTLQLLVAIEALAAI